MEKLSAIETVEQFIKAVKADKTGSFEKALEFCQITWVKTFTLDKAEVFSMIKPLLTGKPEVSEAGMVSDVCIDFMVFSNKGPFKVRAIKESEPYKTDKNGTWGVNPLSFTNAV